MTNKSKRESYDLKRFKSTIFDFIHTIFTYVMLNTVLSLSLHVLRTICSYYIYLCYAEHRIIFIFTCTTDNLFIRQAVAPDPRGDPFRCGL
jgi:hypothetical protein